LFALISVLTLASLGPVYVNTPVALSYVNDPPPPVSVTLIDPRALACVKYKLVEPSGSVSVSTCVKSKLAPVCKLTLASARASV